MTLNNEQDALKTVTVLSIDFETNYQNEYNTFRIDTDSLNDGASDSYSLDICAIWQMQCNLRTIMNEKIKIH